MNSTKYTNPSYAIQHDSERYFWIVYHVFVLLSSLLGDSLILFASFQKDALKLHSFIVVVIEYIAVLDIAYSIIWIIPTTLSLIENSPILSNILCCVQGYLCISIGTAIAWLTPVLTTSKLLVLKNPLRSASWTKNNRAHIVCWLSLIPSVLEIVKMSPLTSEYTLAGTCIQQIFGKLCNPL